MRSWSLVAVAVLLCGLSAVAVAETDDTGALLESILASLENKHATADVADPSADLPQEDIESAGLTNHGESKQILAILDQMKAKISKVDSAAATNVVKYKQSYDDAVKEYNTVHPDAEKQLALINKLIAIVKGESDSDVMTGKSCYDIKQKYSATQDGVYTLDTSAGKIRAYCDMNNNGGGWTLVGVAMFPEHGKAGWNSNSALNMGSAPDLNSHWHYSADLINSLDTSKQFRANCFNSNNNYARIWYGVGTYSWGAKTRADKSTDLNGKEYPAVWADHHWGLTSGNNEKDAVITSHSGNEWACAGNAGPGGEGYTGRGGKSNMRIWVR